ncbi:A-kinase anchoring protein 7 isoform X2 [Microcaecilia unicolor]|uniref:A-kinase anchoring protein 7 isoform X2 n=1 Tax=Microcaecilia unicolor TaxID=1415580 RepID=A0A6P7XP14_9AMPH|nr:A-kinase anchoring protein 7 isoform X2 [Microcaecilia unicolor]
MFRTLFRLCSPSLALHRPRQLRFVWAPLSLPPVSFPFPIPQRGTTLPLLPRRMELPEEKQSLLAEHIPKEQPMRGDESITKEQVDTQKTMKVGRRRRSKSASSETLDSLLVELPFANVDSGDALDYESITKQQVDRQQKKLKAGRRKRGRRSKSATSETLDSLLAELPFANVDSGEVFDTTATPDNGSLKKKRKRTVGLENEGEDPKKKKEKKSKPNYFISLPVRNQKILDNIRTLQDTVVQKEHRLSKAMIPQGTFHLTLFVLHLANEEEIALAVCALTETKSLVEELLGGRPLVLSFHGIGEFRNAVVFVRLKGSDPAEATLTMITKTMMKLFKEKGILIGENNTFTPHLTFMKLSRSPKLRKQGLKKIDPSLYEDFKNHYFGDETVTNLDLCAMLKKKQPNGYYHCECTITVGEKNKRVPDDAELVSLSKRLVENAVLKAVQQYLEETQNKNRHTGGSAMETANSNKNGNDSESRK